MYYYRYFRTGHDQKIKFSTGFTISLVEKYIQNNVIKRLLIILLVTSLVYVINMVLHSLQTKLLLFQNIVFYL